VSRSGDGVQRRNCNPALQVHQGEFVRGSYGRIGTGVGASASEEEDAGDSLSDDGDPLMGVRLSKGVGGAVAAPAAQSSLSDAAAFNPYSFSQRTAAAESFSSSDSDAPPLPLLPKGKKLLPVASSLPAVRLPAVAGLQGQAAAGGGPVLSGYDSWSEDDVDAEAARGEDDWSDTDAPPPHQQEHQELQQQQQQQQQSQQPLSSHKLKPSRPAPLTSDPAPTAAAAVPSNSCPLNASSGSSAAERVDAWAARYAAGGLLALMLSMRRCVQGPASKPLSRNI
jgi:hypothetical protein